MRLGRVYHPELYNCVDFVDEMLREHGLQLPDECQKATSALGFMLAIRRGGWAPVTDRRDLDLMVFKTAAGLHVGLWYDHKVWHCDGQSQATDPGIMSAHYKLLGVYRHGNN